MVETKNGESYDGTLKGLDSFMNVHLEKVTITSANGASFSKCANQCFIRGNNVKAIQFDQEVVKKHQEEIKKRQAESLEQKRKKDQMRKEQN